VLEVLAVIGREWSIERQRGRGNPGVLRTHWPTCRPCICSNPRPDGTEIVVGVKQFEAAYELLKESRRRAPQPAEIAPILSSATDMNDKTNSDPRSALAYPCARECQLKT
jgi:hypothetical protein